MPRLRVYDKAKYHFGGSWPTGLDVEQAYVHTGLFLAWAICRDLISDELRSDQRDALDTVRRRSLTGPQFFRTIDGVLDSTMLSDEGNEFVAEYFDLRDGPFVEEYETLLARDLPTVYHVPDTWESFDRLSQHLDRRLAEWRERRSRMRRGGPASPDAASPQ